MMGCFSDCLRTPKCRKPRKVSKRNASAEQIPKANEAAQVITVSSNQGTVETPFKPVEQSEEKVEGELKFGNQKKVTFDLNVKTCEEKIRTHEISDCNGEINEEKGEKETPKKTLVSHTYNYRYQNCTNSDDEEYEGLELENSDFDDDGDENDPKSVQEENSESLFSISIGSKAHAHIAEMDDKEVNSPMPNCGLHLHESPPIGPRENAEKGSKSEQSVLNPVENLTQWKAARAIAKPPLGNEEKENVNLQQDHSIPISPAPSFNPSMRSSKLNSKSSKPSGRGIAVDTSLSSWLEEKEPASSAKSGSFSVENSPSAGANSSLSPEDRPILGAWTVAELKQISSPSPPRRSPRRSPDDMPIIGTVGSYWSHTGQAMDSDSGSSCKAASNASNKCREDQRVKWNSIPFEKRLENALNMGVAEF